jgi:hypothetical protein
LSALELFAKLGKSPRSDDLDGRVAGLEGELETNLTKGVMSVWVIICEVGCVLLIL